MMMFTMGWWLTAVHPSLKTAAASSSAISLILPMFLPSMNLSSFGISLVVKYVRCGSVVSLTPPGLVLM